MNRVLIISFLFLSGCFIAKAQSFNGSFSSNINVGTVVNMTLTPNVSSNITLDGTNLQQGYSNNAFSSVQIKSNASWLLNVRSATTYFTASGIYASSNMPASILSLSSPGKQVSLSTQDKLLSSGTRGNASASGNSFNVGLIANPGYNYGPGIYSINIIYTLTAQ